jgi:dTDP-4-dehydrorhamnose reductase
MRLLISGASGVLGRYLLQHLATTNHKVTAWSGEQSGAAFGFPLLPVPLTDADAIKHALRAAQPDAVIHAAAVASVAKCYESPDAAWHVNVDATRSLLTIASDLSARFVFVSTDLVFDGRHGSYKESDEARPLSIYAHTKLAAEQAVLAYDGGAAVRLSLLFGPALGDRRSFFDEQLAALSEGRPCRLFTDEWRTPLALPTAASALVKVAETGFTGTLHVGGPERMSRMEMGERLARLMRLDPTSIVPTTRDSTPGTEERPRDTSLDSSRWRSQFAEHPWPVYEVALREMGVRVETRS